MSARIPVILAITVAATVPGAAVKAACAAKSSYRCVDTGSPVNLNVAPEITSKIAGEEPISAKSAKSGAEPTTPAPYTGPIFGVTSGKRAPTVGYSWSLE